MKGGDAYGKVPKESSNVIAMNETLSIATGQCKQFQGGFTEGKEGALARGKVGFFIVIARVSRSPEHSEGASDEAISLNGQPVMRQA